MAMGNSKPPAGVAQPSPPFADRPAASAAPPPRVDLRRSEPTIRTSRNRSTLEHGDEDWCHDDCGVRGADGRNGGEQHLGPLTIAVVWNPPLKSCAGRR